MKLFEKKEEQKDGGSVTSAGPLKRITDFLTGGMTAAEKKTTCACSVIGVAAVIYCFAVTFCAIHTLCLFAAVLLIGLLLRFICILNEKRSTYKSKTWAVYFILLAAAASYMFTVYTYDYKADPFNLLTGAKTINTYDDAVKAANNNYTNTFIEIGRDDLCRTDYSYAVQHFKGGSLLDSSTLYEYYLLKFDGRFVLCRVEPDYFSEYFEQKERNGDGPTRIYASRFDYADAGTYDSIYTPTLELYPGGGEEYVPLEERLRQAEKEAEAIQKDPDANETDYESPDYFSEKHKTYLKYYSDLPLYELNGDFVLTIKDYDLNMQKTILLGMIAFSVMFLNALFCVLFHPKKQTEDPVSNKRFNKKKRKK